ncbi:hypothetical protein MGG_08113 [Pyricularia oryzae 70-15]|uniref:MARVEL domain-containing protein n=3 Tax=Pyricularia oryzae TaxID=318829 RepID=G4MYC7_PYRO7|nr:uncharacterized protein MGG_08113 [Pyricularia oryzae 70-15]EHA55262.1 hypothetical protein MGG_08113 [Pyricularia oryzae 70-15]ELQ44235.1 hypothetical protein OOU_Y34scaffold00094g25 [Pyricularia oryzae Y34]KAI7916039.1 hypothetical protein M0657_008793 [Pyricularia oryzae]KAI7926219.1 hypothetical protein M9X92_002809 [Pyricularia oryzae]
MHSIIGLGLKGFLLIASAVVLGLSVTLENHQKYGSPPAETSFASFTGGFGIVVAAIGVASMFIDAIPTLVPLVVEGLAALFFLAGGIALAIAMKGVSCDGDLGSEAYGVRFFNKILNGGCPTVNRCYVSDKIIFSPEEGNDSLKARCVRTQADFAFQFIAMFAALGALAMTFFTARRSGTRVIA